LGGEFPRIFETREDGLDFLAGQDDRRPAPGVAWAGFSRVKSVWPKTFRARKTIAWSACFWVEAEI
jgi:hypothetical protein